MRHINICIIQPSGYVHSLGFLDQARYLRYQFRKFGVTVSLFKNRLVHDAINIVLGAHLGFNEGLKSRYICIFFNLEQLGRQGAKLSQSYLELLGNSAVFDYDKDNLIEYTKHIEDVPLLSFGYAPYLEQSVIPISEREIDLLFIGSMNERRAEILNDIENSGVNVAMLDAPLYGPERDSIIAQAKAVINCHFYEAARFEQARVFQCLSLGTPVISERLPSTFPPENFEDSVFWVRDGQWGKYINEVFLDKDFSSLAEEKISNFKKHENIEVYADAFVFSQSFAKAYSENISNLPWAPKLMHIGSGKNYLMGWLNVDISSDAMPDMVFDLSLNYEWPQKIQSSSVGEVILDRGQFNTIYADNVLEHVKDLPQMMTNCLDILEEDGIFEIIVPYEKSNAAWQDPTHVRAMNEDSWIYYADWFWYLGWFEFRFHVQEFLYLNNQSKACEKEDAMFMKVTLVKKATTLSERMTARMQQANFGGIPEDTLLA